eukprot:9474738-Pyramimonas_sp.AAC.1
MTPPAVLAAAAAGGRSKKQSQSVYAEKGEERGGFGSGHEKSARGSKGKNTQQQTLTCPFAVA